MSFLSVLGKIGKFALPFVPGVGPIADKVIDGVQVAGQMAGGAANQRSQDRGAQAEYDGMRVPLQNAQQLQYAQARQGADQNRMRQIGSADMLGSMKKPTDPRAIMGGGGEIDPETIAMMRERAMSALKSGSDVPQMQQLPAEPGGGATGMDSFLRTLSGVGTGLGALQESGLFQPRQPQQSSTLPNQGGGVQLPSMPQVGAIPEDERPWWLKQAPATMRGN